MNKYCTNCGHLIAENAAFCGNCGTSTRAENVRGTHISIGGNVGRDVISAGGDITKSEINNSNVRFSPFEIAKQELESLNSSDTSKIDANLAIERLAEQDNNGQANPDAVNRWFNILEAVAPTVAKVFLEAVLSPGAAISTAMLSAIKSIRK